MGIDIHELHRLNWFGKFGYFTTQSLIIVSLGCGAVWIGGLKLIQEGFGKIGARRV